jgi:hypothetical protein
MVLSTGSYFVFVDNNNKILTWKSHACKGRYQISLDRNGGKQGGNDHIDTETRHCIRNFRVTQIVCIS